MGRGARGGGGSDDGRMWDELRLFGEPGVHLPLASGHDAHTSERSSLSNLSRDEYRSGFGHALDRHLPDAGLVLRESRSERELA
jgi:hypothetical protein